MKHARDRLTSLLNTLEVDKINDYQSLNIIADFATLIATQFEGFSMILEPYPEDLEKIGRLAQKKNPLL